MIATSPALTWTCLFTPDATYRYSGPGNSGVEPPPWVRELVCAHGGDGHGGRPVHVITDGSGGDHLPDLASLPGLVTVNCRRLSDRALRSAGFSYVRRFAVLPDLARARFFVPLDSPAVAAAGFALWEPVRPAARCTYRVARAAARVGVPVWYRDQICVAQREAPPLERVLRDLFPGESVRVALSSGSPPPTRNRKVAIAVLGNRGRLLAFGKLPGPLPVAHARVRHEAEFLRALNGRPGPAVAPRLLFAGPVGDTFLAVTDPLPGRQPGAAWTPAHYQLLDRLRGPDVKPVDQTAFVAAIKAEAAQLEDRPDLHRALGALLPRLREMVLPAGIVHGDFAPWNLRRHAGALAAFDWESACRDGPPLIDEVHHLLATGYLLEKWSAERALARLGTFARSAPNGLGPAAVNALTSVYLIEYLLRLFAEGYGNDYPRVAWCRELVNHLARANVSGGPTR